MINFAVVGCGRISGKHLSSLKISEYTLKKKAVIALRGRKSYLFSHLDNIYLTYYFKEDIEYFFALTAYDNEDNVSGYSSEVNYIAMSQPPEEMLPATMVQLLLKAIDLPPPIKKKLIMGRDYEITILPDGSILYILPNANPGDNFIWSK